MADRAKIFKSGGSQAVRLPVKYRFVEGEEVLIYREGLKIILEPLRKSWSQEFRQLAGSAVDFPYPEEPPELEPGPNFQ
jgi:antitoxin VapB